MRIFSPVTALTALSFAILFSFYFQITKPGKSFVNAAVAETQVIQDYKPGNLKAGTPLDRRLYGDDFWDQMELHCSKSGECSNEDYRSHQKDPGHTYQGLTTQIIDSVQDEIIEQVWGERRAQVELTPKLVYLNVTRPVVWPTSTATPQPTESVSRPSPTAAPTLIEPTAEPAPVPSLEPTLSVATPEPIDPIQPTVVPTIEPVSPGDNFVPVSPPPIPVDGPPTTLFALSFLFLLGRHRRQSKQEKA